MEDLDAAFEADDEVDLQLRKERKQIIIGKSTLCREPNAMGLDLLKDQFESAFDDGQFVALHPPFA